MSFSGTITQKLAIRTDASETIGFGHLKRCLVLARELASKQEVIFISHPFKEAVSLIQQSGFKVITLTPRRRSYQNDEAKEVARIIKRKKIDKILIDFKRNVSRSYIQGLKKTDATIILLDNLGEGRKDADVVIYPTAWLSAYHEIEKGIKGKLYHGWDYVIVDKKFFGQRKRAAEGELKILVTMGGSDSQDVTSYVVKALRKIKENFFCTVVVGPAFKKKKWHVDDKRFKFQYDVKNLAPLMLESDIGILLLGVSVYEAAAARLPIVLISVSERNRRAAEVFREYGTSIYVGDFKKIDEANFVKQVRRLLDDRKLRLSMQNQAKRLCKPERKIYSVI